jgi:hypothetical protein
MARPPYSKRLEPRLVFSMDPIIGDALTAVMIG